MINKALSHSVSKANLINDRTSTELYVDVVDGILKIVVFGAIQKLDFKQAFSIHYKYQPDWHCWVHSRTYDKFFSVVYDLEDYINEDNFDKIEIQGFSQGAAIAILIYEWLIRSIGYPDNKIETCFEAPYKVIPGYNQRVYYTDKDIVQHWPLFIKKPTRPEFQKSPYKWYQFVKNHFYQRELACRAN